MAMLSLDGFHLASACFPPGCVIGAFLCLPLICLCVALYSHCLYVHLLSLHACLLLAFCVRLCSLTTSAGMRSARCSSLWLAPDSFGLLVFDHFESILLIENFLLFRVRPNLCSELRVFVTSRTHTCTEITETSGDESTPRRDAAARVLPEIHHRRVRHASAQTEFGWPLSSLPTFPPSSVFPLA
eukprot:1200893-Pleurochrysis_carterae.AAC.1